MGTGSSERRNESGDEAMSLGMSLATVGIPDERLSRTSPFVESVGEKVRANHIHSSGDETGSGLVMSRASSPLV